MLKLSKTSKGAILKGVFGNTINSERNAAKNMNKEKP
jgi:hypothetical protein